MEVYGHSWAQLEAQRAHFSESSEPGPWDAGPSAARSRVAFHLISASFCSVVGRIYYVSRFTFPSSSSQLISEDVRKGMSLCHAATFDPNNGMGFPQVEDIVSGSMRRRFFEQARRDAWEECRQNIMNLRDLGADASYSHYIFRPRSSDSLRQSPASVEDRGIHPGQFCHSVIVYQAKSSPEIA